MFGMIPVPVRHPEYAVSEPWFVSESGACQCTSDVSRSGKGETPVYFSFKPRTFFFAPTDPDGLDVGRNSNYEVRYERFKESRSLFFVYGVR
jgi:hypothetical protein